MNLFDRLVDEALANQIELTPLRSVVEKELLHHDILREMSQAGLLAKLTFMGGTCLRACYGSSRLSEDLDFTGGADFNRESLAALAEVLVVCLKHKYGLPVEVSEPTREVGNVDTWKLKVQTRPQQRDMPAQRINIDICAVPSYAARPIMLRNPYGVDMGTSGLILRAQSREEIFADKLIAFALRPNRLKNRDLWDMAWLQQQGVVLPLALLPGKLADRRLATADFLTLLNARSQMLLTETKLREDFRKEMQRFLPVALVRKTVDQAVFWDYLIGLVADLCSGAVNFLASGGDAGVSTPHFKM